MPDLPIADKFRKKALLIDDPLIDDPFVGEFFYLPVGYPDGVEDGWTRICWLTDGQASASLAVAHPGELPIIACDYQRLWQRHLALVTRVEENEILAVYHDAAAPADATSQFCLIRLTPEETPKRRVRA